MPNFDQNVMTVFGRDIFLTGILNCVIHASFFMKTDRHGVIWVGRAARGFETERIQSWFRQKLAVLSWQHHCPPGDEAAWCIPAWARDGNLHGVAAAFFAEWCGAQIRAPGDAEDDTRLITHEMKVKVTNTKVPNRGIIYKWIINEWAKHLQSLKIVKNIIYY